MISFKKVLSAVVLFLLQLNLGAQQFPDRSGLMDVGVAQVDITPEMPVRLAGYGARTKEEATEVMHRLTAKAMAFGNDMQNPSILITIDLLGISERITTVVKNELAEKAGIDPAHVAICASHTHGGPEIGSSINILYYRDIPFGDSAIALSQLIHLAQYTETLKKKLVEVSLRALNERRPSLVYWGQGQASFAANRRTKGGPVDVALPIIKVTDAAGNLSAVLVSYACHGTTLEGINEIHGDWISEAQLQIEANHPGTLAMVAVGCGGDANPRPRGEIEHMKQHGKEIADNVDKLLKGQLVQLTVPPVGKIKWIDLPFAHVPDVYDLIKLTEDKGLRGYYARVALERTQRGIPVSPSVRYPVQVWNFGNDLAMINLAGEVVVDYSLRLKHELGAEHLWVNGYTNDVPCYIASRRVIREGGYEADFSMVCYDKPGPFVEEIEDMIIDAVHEITPQHFKAKRDSVNSQQLVVQEADGILHLTAAKAKSVGPNIKYMPEWKAFGWFNTDDRAEWTTKVDKAGKYDVYLKWSVSDGEAGKSFAFDAGKKIVKGKIAKTGSWYTYSTARIGTVELPAGMFNMVFRSNAPSEKGAMLDLAEVVLVPARARR